MCISEAARRLGTSARMLRYREDLGLLPRVRDGFRPSHRQFSDEDVEAVAASVMRMNADFNNFVLRMPVSKCGDHPGSRSVGSGRGTTARSAKRI